MFDLLDLDLGDPVQVEALRLWRAREARWPAFVRRPDPDHLDVISGAWGRALRAARRRIDGGGQLSGNPG